MSVSPPLSDPMTPTHTSRTAPPLSPLPPWALCTRQWWVWHTLAALAAAATNNQKAMFQ